MIDIANVVFDLDENDLRDPSSFSDHVVFKLFRNQVDKFIPDLSTFNIYV